MSTPKRFRVAVCGAGIGGLTCALALSNYPDIAVEVYEGASTLAEVGAGIGLFPRPWRVMQMLGLDRDLLNITEVKPKDGPVPSFTYRKSDQHQGLNFYTLVTKGNLITFHRADFQQVLLRRLPQSCKIYCSKRLRSYTQPQSGPIQLQFEDGSTALCDLLIGADGLKSVVRRSLLDEKAQWARAEGRRKEAAELMTSVDPVWSGTTAYRAVIPAARLQARAPGHRVFTQPTQYLGKHGYIIAYPISKGKMVNFVAFNSRHDLENTPFTGPWVSAADKSEFAGLFSRWEPEAQALIDCAEKPLKWAIHTVKPLRSFVSGRVALIGDAAHAMSPHQGSGAGQAIEDGYILATLLGHPRTTRDSIHRALHIYDEIRRPAALRVAEKSRLNGLYFTLNIDGIDFDRLSGDYLWSKLQQLSRTFTRNWEWAWTTTVDGSLKEAVRMLECP